MADTSLKYFMQVLSVISEFDISDEDCLRAAGLSELPKSDRVNSQVLTDIFNFAATNLNDPQIGLKCALKYPLLQYTRPAEFLKLCKNLEQAADLYNHYSPLFHTVGTPSGITSENGVDRMVWIPSFAPNLTEDNRQFIEFIMTNLVTSINWLAWKTSNAVQQLNIKHEAVLPLTEYETLLECDVKFGQSEYSLILKDDVKDAPFAMSNQAELARVRVKFNMALNKLLKDQSIVDRIEFQIRNSIETGVPNKASVARALGLSERTMARNLKEKGTCFKDIKNRVLKDLAVAKINQGLPLVEVAHALGYNDQSAFTRAYKRWFGSSPRNHNVSGH